MIVLSGIDSIFTDRASYCHLCASGTADGHLKDGAMKSPSPTIGSGYDAYDGPTSDWI